MLIFFTPFSSTDLKTGFFAFFFKKKNFRRKMSSHGNLRINSYVKVIWGLLFWNDVSITKHWHSFARESSHHYLRIFLTLAHHPIFFKGDSGLQEWMTKNISIINSEVFFLKKRKGKWKFMVFSLYLKRNIRRKYSKKYSKKITNEFKKIIF